LLSCYHKGETRWGKKKVAIWGAEADKKRTIPGAEAVAVEAITAAAAMAMAAATAKAKEIILSTIPVSTCGLREAQILVVKLALGALIKV